jgi:hypothetical protein
MTTDDLASFTAIRLSIRARNVRLVVMLVYFGPRGVSPGKILLYTSCVRENITDCSVLNIDIHTALIDAVQRLTPRHQLKRTSPT